MKSHKIVNTSAATNATATFATNQTAAMHCLDDPLEYIREKISLALFNHGPRLRDRQGAQLLRSQTI